MDWVALSLFIHTFVVGGMAMALGVIIGIKSKEE